MNERKVEKVCEICHKSFANTFTLNRHRTQYHQLAAPKKTSSIKCHICEEEQRSHADLIYHLNTSHSLCISIENKSFQSEEGEFNLK